MAQRRSLVFAVSGLVFFATTWLASAGEPANGALGQSGSESLAVNESARGIPVATNVDVVVVGGGSAAVAAAVAARQAGASVFVVASRPYLGEDLAGTLRLWLESDEKVKGVLAESIFGTAGYSTPGKLKRVLDDALVAAKADFLYSCYATDVLTDAAGKPCGVVMANRTGRQAVIAKVTIDATENATVARLAGARFVASVAGPQTVKWVTIAKQSRTEANQTVRKLPIPVDQSSGRHAASTEGTFWFEYTLRLGAPDGSWAARARLEQMVRDQTYHETQLYSADVPFVIPADSMAAAHPAIGAWPGADQVALGVFRPEGLERLWVLGGCAGLSREHMEKLLRPVAFMEIGARIGAAAAEEAGQVPVPQGVRVVRRKAITAAPGEVKELSSGIHPYPKPATVPQEEGALPVLGRYDVVVVGGGTAGAPAGIGAARQGARTLVIEYLHGLGGVGTLGMIGGYWHGNRVGFTSHIPASPVEKRMEWYRRELRQAHGELWFGVLGCGTLVEGNRVTGVVVSTPQGRGIVLAKVVVDGTGNSDIPIAAGADFIFVDDPNDVYAMQAAHLPQRNVGDSYNNGNRKPTDDANPSSATRYFQSGRGKTSFDVGQLIDSRERRRIVGDYCLDWLDILNKRTFPDSIELAKSDYDSHGGNTHVFFKLRPRPRPESGNDFWSYVPYRCLLPKGLEGVLVVGLGMSAHRDAMPIVRMQPDMHNQGYAAGVAAAMAVKAGVTPRQVDVRGLQRHLVEVGNLKPEVLTHTDSYPMRDDRIKAAAEHVVNGFQDVEILLAQPGQSVSILRQAYESATGDNKVTYACLLGIMGDSTGVPTILEAVKQAKPSIQVKPAKPAEQNLLIMALGYARDHRAVPVLVDLASQSGTLKAAAEALGRIGDPAGAAPLGKYLALRAQKGSEKNAPKMDLKNDLVVVCALWRCGDQDDLARRILESIIAEDNGLYAHLAWKLLNSRPKAGQ